MDRMNPLDASFLYLEQGTFHMHVGSLSLFEGPVPSQPEVLALFRAKLPAVPRYRQRVVFVPFDLGRPVWVDDPDFDLAYHVRRTAVPSPGGVEQLERLMGRLMSQELDRDRPLWEAWVVEGLPEDRWALISKVHHCMIDGVAGVDLISVVLDHTPDPEPVTPPVDEWRPAPPPSGVRLALDALGELGKLPFEQARAARQAVTDPNRSLARARQVARGLRSYRRTLRPVAPSSLQGPIGAHRRWTSTRVTLEDIRTIRSALGGTVNDVVLAAVTRGHRDLALARGEDPAVVGLRTLVPVSVRPPDAHDVLDNRVSAIFFDLPIAVADPVERLEAVRREMTRLKGSHEAEAGEALTSLIGLVPPAVTAGSTRLAVRLLSEATQPGVGTVTTNVPGPPTPLYAVGREMLEHLPYVPIGPGMRIGVAVLSYAGTVGFGVTGDFDSAADLTVVAAGIDAEIAALLEAATAAPTPARPDGSTAGARQPASDARS